MKTHISKLDVAILREDFGFGFSRLMEYTDEEETERATAKHSEGSEPSERATAKHSEGSEPKEGSNDADLQPDKELASDSKPGGDEPAAAGGEHGFGSHAGAGEIAAAAAVATGIGAAGMAVYKRFFSAAAKACGGKSGAEKTACMQQYKQKGLQAYKTSISSNASKCNKSKNPAACKEALKKKMARFG